jgi:hypothetical protein
MEKWGQDLGNASGPAASSLVVYRSRLEHTLEAASSVEDRTPESCPQSHGEPADSAITYWYWTIIYYIYLVIFVIHWGAVSRALRMGKALLM